MAPTTLVTFLVRTPPATRSVSLYGSWDNFKTSYPMHRDARIGPEHWAGCHSFSNIICDGDVPNPARPRDGGLKMGGTYWYFYQLDDDVDFHNSAEPSTTACPLLPGQLVNVLHVPFALSAGRARNDSVTSVGSDVPTLTMDPAAKFMNPRPAPTKPVLRVKTSPPLPSDAWSGPPTATAAGTPTSAAARRGRSNSAHTPSSQPTSATTIQAMRRAKKSATESPSRSRSRGRNRALGLLDAFRALASPRVASPDDRAGRGRAETTSSAPASRAASNGSVTPTSRRPRHMSPAASSGNPAAALQELALRKEVDARGDEEPVTLGHSFAQHRRERSLSKEPSALRIAHSVGLSTPPSLPDHPGPLYQPLEPLKEVATPGNPPLSSLTPKTAACVATAVDDALAAEVKGPLDLEKRLPTLPNTPSSVYPPSVVAEPLPPGSSDGMPPLQRPSGSPRTVGAESGPDRLLDPDRSHFSDWTCSTTARSPASECAPDCGRRASSEPPQQESRSHVLAADPSSHVADAETERVAATGPAGLPSTSSLSTISSVASSTAGSSHAEPHAPDARHSWTEFQHYTLPPADVGSGVTLQPAKSAEDAAPLVVKGPHTDETYPPSRDPFDRSVLAHSEGMRQLLDELSYLGGIIQQE